MGDFQMLLETIMYIDKHVQLWSGMVHVQGNLKKIQDGPANTTGLSNTYTDRES